MHFDAKILDYPVVREASESAQKATRVYMPGDRIVVVGSKTAAINREVRERKKEKKKGAHALHNISFAAFEASPVASRFLSFFGAFLPRLFVSISSFYFRPFPPFCTITCVYKTVLRNGTKLIALIEI